MKRVVLFIAIASTCCLAQPSAHVFHGIKIGETLKSQVPVCNYKDDAPCYSEFTHVDQYRKAEVWLMKDKVKDATLTVIVPDTSTDVGDGIVESVELEYETEQFTDSVKNMTAKYGRPYCQNVSGRTGIGVPIVKTSCTWRLSWGRLFATSMMPDDINTMWVKVSSNRLLETYRKESANDRKHDMEVF